VNESLKSGASAMKKETRNLGIFFVATFLWTWMFYIPIAVSGSSQFQMPWMILLICGGMGPSLVGIAMVLLTYDKEQRREYWYRCFSVRRIRLLWWLVIFLIFPVIFVVSIAVDVALGGSLPGLTQLKSLMANPLTWPLAAFISFMSGLFRRNSVGAVMRSSRSSNASVPCLER
jgi:hypothetical protein